VTSKDACTTARQVVPSTVTSTGSPGRASTPPIDALRQEIA
jgi:hypothetical protein